MPLFRVDIERQLSVFVNAESSELAQKYTQENVYEILRDCEDGEPEISACTKPLRDLKELRWYGWDEDCLAYGDHDGDLTCKEVVLGPPEAPNPPGDVEGQNKMFGED